MAVYKGKISNLTSKTSDDKKKLSDYLRDVDTDIQNLFRTSSPFYQSGNIVTTTVTNLEATNIIASNGTFGNLTVTTQADIATLVVSTGGSFSNLQADFVFLNGQLDANGQTIDNVLNINVTGTASVAQLTLTGGVLCNTTRTNTNYSLLSTDNIVFLDTDGGAIIAALPTGIEGTHYKIINCGSSGNDVTVSATDGATLYGSTTAELADGEIVNIHYNSTEGWW